MSTKDWPKQKLGKIMKNCFRLSVRSSWSGNDETAKIVKTAMTPVSTLKSTAKLKAEAGLSNMNDQRYIIGIEANP